MLYLARCATLCTECPYLQRHRAPSPALPLTFCTPIPAPKPALQGTPKIPAQARTGATNQPGSGDSSGCSTRVGLVLLVCGTGVSGTGFIVSCPLTEVTPKATLPPFVSGCGLHTDVRNGLRDVFLCPCIACLSATKSIFVESQPEMLFWAVFTALKGSSSPVCPGCRVPEPGQDSLFVPCSRCLPGFSIQPLFCVNTA